MWSGAGGFGRRTVSVTSKSCALSPCLSIVKVLWPSVCKPLGVVVDHSRTQVPSNDPAGSASLAKADETEIAITMIDATFTIYDKSF
jgi:hypothetical protein